MKKLLLYTPNTMQQLCQEKGAFWALFEGVAVV